MALMALCRWIGYTTPFAPVLILQPPCPERCQEHFRVIRAAQTLPEGYSQPEMQHRTPESVSLRVLSERLRVVVHYFAKVLAFHRSTIFPGPNFSNKERHSTSEAE